MYCTAFPLALPVPRPLLLLLALLSWSSPGRAQDSLGGTFVVGVDLGELPWHGSFKPGITFGYHVSDLLYVCGIYQLADSIERDGTSFNAQAIGLDGLTSSRETVGHRAMLHARLRPHRLAPFATVGLVYNGEDVETIRFDARDRTIGGASHSGALTIEQTRPAGIALGIGLGYAYTFDHGLQLSLEWTGAPYAPAPRPQLRFDGDQPLPRDAQAALSERVTREFRASVFNTYHLFHVGAAYGF